MSKNAQDIISQQLTPLSNQPSVVYTTEDGLISLDVKVENDTVWLTQAQMVELFQSSKGNISEHIKSIFAQQELEPEATVRKNRTVRIEGNRQVTRELDFYNLDVIISVGFRVNTKRGIAFRKWANAVLKSYLLNGYAFAQRFERIEHRLANVEEQQQVLSLEVHGALPPHEGVFFDGQIFDAYVLASDLIKRATKRVVLIDNYVDESVLSLLDKRGKGVSATIYTANLSKQLKLDIEKHNAQYASIEVKVFSKSHDRFLIVDEDIFHLGASLKDLGKKWFAFSKMSEITAEELIDRIN